MIGRMQKRALAVILALVMVFGQTLTGVLTLTAEAASVDLTNYYVNDVANASDSDTRNGITLTVYDTVNCMPYANYCLGYTGLNGLYIGSALGGEDTAFRATFTTGSVFSAASLSISTYATTSNITIKGYNSVGTPVGDGVTLTSVNSGERRIADLSADGDFSSISTLEISSSNSDFMIYSLDIGSANTAPTATDVSVGGTAKVGQTLTGSYTYGDADSDTESGSIYKWYRATDASGTGAAAISGATSNTYDLTSDDLGKYVCFEVTPSDGTDSGTAVKSSYTGPVAAAPDTTAPTVTDKTIAASDLTATGVTLSWNKATDDTSAQTALEYLVYQSSSDNLDTVEHIEANGAAVGSYAADIATKDVTDLTTGTTYYFNVIVKDEAGNKTCYTANSVTTEVGLELGAAVFTGGKYSYPNAEVSGSGIKTLLISFSKSTADGDEIVLPTAPAGFTVSSTSNDYTKRINLDDGILTSTVQEYLRGIGFAIASATQTVSITITTESITADTFYYAATEHYYQFIPAGESGVTWTDAYTAAEGMSYMGRTGYLATVMSLGEDTFLNSLSDGSTGWLGGTILMNSGIRVDADGAAAADGRYYSLFTTTSFVSDGWYWACGPEIGTIFYNVNSINLVDGTNEAEKASNADADNPDTYYNWSRTGACEPNNTSGGENCLTTLMISGRTGSQGTSFTWNDIAYNNTDQSSDFSAKGYFVEYGNLLTGDNGSGSAAFASASGDLVFVSSDATLKTSSTIKGETVSLGTPAAMLGSETAGSVTLTPEQAADTSNAGSYITLFDKNDENAAVKAVKYASGASTENFATDAAYADEAIDNGDFFIVKVTAQDGVTVNYYKIHVIVTVEVELTDVTWKSASTYTCGITMSSPCRIIAISVDSGYFTVPSLGSDVLTFLGGTNGTTYINSYSAEQQFDGVVFSFTDGSAAETLLGNIVYSLNGAAQQGITATASTVFPQTGDLYFEGHFYRYVAGSINWVDAALAAGNTEDPYFGGRGYLATATSQAENSILLKLVDTGGTSGDHWNDAWMGGLWQRNTGTVESPSITRGTDGNEISYSDLCDTTLTEQQNLFPHYATFYSEDDVCDGSTSYINEHPEAVLYYWLDGPEAGQEIANNVTDGFSPWHSGEPNGGDFVYIGWQGAYWDDLSAYDGSSFSKLSGYIVEFSGFGDGGSTEDVIASDVKTTNADTTAPGVTDKTITSSNITRTGATLSWNKAADDCSAQADLQYLVYRSSSNNLGTVTDIEANGTALGSYAADIATKDAADLTAGTTYYFNVIVKDMAGNKTCYTTKFVTTLPPITASLTPAEALTEENLNTNSLTVALSQVTFTDETLDPANFTLNNAPTGVSIESVEYTDTTHCTVNLAYDDTDFDSNVTTFSLTIAVAELSEGEDLTSDELTITALVETAPTVTTDGVTTYTATTAVLGGDVTASGGESVTERGVVYSSADSTPEIGETDVTKNDNGTGTDTFSETTTGLAQGTKYYVRAYATNIEGTSYGSVEEFTTPTITMALTPAEALTEENLDTNSFTVALSYVTFTDETLDPANFTLNNAPTGVGIESVEYTDTTHCTVNLAYDDTDFDSNVTTFSLTIAVAELSEGEDLTSDELTITATVEPAPTVTSLSPRRGRILGGTSVTIYGTNFEHVTAVYFGEEEASSYIVVSETKITAVSPAGSVGTVHVTVTTKGGTSAETSANKFAYYRKSSSSSGLNDDDTETHAVTFRDWDGTVLKIQIVEDGKSASAPQVPEREGYTFTGWDKEYSEITENMAVTAKYTANIYGTGVYTITFNSNGGSIVKSQSIPYGGNVKDPDDPVRDGYTFGGWYLDAGFTQKYDFTSAIGANVTLYAKWIPNEGTEQTALPLEVEFTFAQGDGWECVTANFTAHGIGSEGAEITWSSSDPDVIRMEQGDDGMIGIVTRPQGHDESVVLTVTATEDNNTVSRTFLLIVRQEGVSAAETYAETGRTASAQSGNSAGSEPIYRSALDNDTKIDSVALTADTVRKLIEQGGMSDSIVMTIGDFAADPASEYAFEVLSEAIAALSQNELGLTLASPAGTVEIPAEEIERAAQSGTMICFRIMQARDETEEAKADFLGDPSVFSKPDMTGKVIGVPKKIETNLEDLAAAVILPVKGLSEEQMADEAFLKTLGVYVEHSGGTTELVDGTLVYEDGEPVGIRFEINGFSRFQVVSVEEAVVTEPAEAAPSLWIWIACAAAGLAVLVAVFLIAIRRKKESRENARS